MRSLVRWREPRLWNHGSTADSPDPELKWITSKPQAFDLIGAALIAVYIPKRRYPVIWAAREAVVLDLLGALTILRQRSAISNFQMLTDLARQTMPRATGPCPRI